MRIDATYNTCVDILRKERNGFVSIADFNLRAYPAILDAFNFFAKDFGVNQPSHDALTPFKLPLSGSTDANGVFVFPGDYARLLRIKPATAKYAVSFYNENEIDDAVISQVRPISATYVVGELANSSAQLYPQQVISVTGSYLRLPKQPVYNATIIGRSIVYNPTGSQDIEFSDLYIWKTIQGIVQRSGINLSDDKAIAYSQLIQPSNATN